MATLESPLDVKVYTLNGKTLCRLLEPLTHGKITVPIGFITDFASVPRIFWNIFPPFGRYQNAAVIHDFMYVNKTGGKKSIADKMFLENMKILGVPFWKRQLMYYAVKFGGKGNYVN